MAKNHFLNPADVLNSQRCIKVINKLTGAEFERDPDPRAGWEFLYQRAAIHPEEFECIYSKQKDEHGKILYTEADLKILDVAQLQTIANGMGLSGRGKKELILNILSGQSEN